jgi:hypothetical protein
MAIEVEVNLAIPRVKVPVKDENGYPIDNGSVRFTKTIEVSSIPKPGAPLQLTTSAGHEFECTVTRSDWHEERGLFVLSCKYAKRSITADECAALYSDTEWKVRTLLQKPGCPATPQQ